MLLRSRISHGFPTIAVFKRPRNTHSADDFTFFKKTNSLLYTTRPLITRGLFYDVISTTESCLTSIHNSTCLPWWAVISGTTLLLRSVLTVPLAVYQQKIGARIELLKPLISEYAEAIKHNVVVKCRREDQPVEEANRRIRKEVRKMTRELYSQEKCHPLKTFLLPWSQIPLWIVLSFAIRNLCGALPNNSIPLDTVSLSSLSTEGVLWFIDLTLPDQYCILPLLLGTTNLLNIEVHSLRRSDPTRFQRIFTNSFRLLSVSAGIISTQLPTALTLYWTVSSSFSLIQNLVLMSPRIKRLFNIPHTPKEAKTPYKDLVKLANLKGRKFLEKQQK